MTRPRVLDLFCGEGGAARGYMAAGFEVWGVDTKASVQRYYPGTILKGDWRTMTEFLRDRDIDFDLVHASPPCQSWSHGTVALDKTYPELIEPVREYLLGWGVPFVIENVPRAPLVNAVTLCGTMFGLTAFDDDGTDLYLRRHRKFEAHGFSLAPPPGRVCECAAFDRIGWRCAGVYGGGRTDKHEARHVRKGGYTPKSKALRARLMGVDRDEFTLKGLSEAIPPAYGKWVGEQFLASVEVSRGVV